MKRYLGLVFGALLAAAALFGISATTAWWNAWAFLLFMAILGGATSALIGRIPGLAEERRTAAPSAAPWDRRLVRLVNIALPAMLILAALDVRFRWTSPVPAAVSAAAFAGMVPAAMLTYRAIAANPFFSSHVRIQRDRGHRVVSSGPYRIVRHPGYAGSALFNLLAPLALGSWTALVPGLAAALLLVYRTGREDAALLEELPGYAAYARQVPKRLVPGVW